MTGEKKAPPKLAEVPSVGGPEQNVIDTLENLLKRARAGEIIAVAAAYELRGGYSDHIATFGSWGNRPLLVGRLQLLATHIILNECLEWQPK